MENDNNPARLPSLLSKLGKLTSIRDTELLEQSLLKTLGPQLGVLDTSLYRSDDEETLTRVIHFHRSRETDAEGGSRVVEQIEQIHNLQEVSADVVAVTDNVRLLARPCARRLENGLLIAYPLLGDNNICGYFVFHRDHDVTPAEDAIIRGVLEVFSNYYALLDASLRDRLTGLFNRQALENSFERLWTALARPVEHAVEMRGRRPAPINRYWVAVIDVDHFKRVNDEYGHIVGDEILLLAARVMENTFRSSDLLYRYGGEEFVAIVSAESDAIARNIFERVRLTIEAHVFPRVSGLTVSIGYSRANPAFLPQEVLSRADRSLYQAKQLGRNRVCEYEELVKTGVFKEIGYGDSELF